MEKLSKSHFQQLKNQNAITYTSWVREDSGDFFWHMRAVNLPCMPGTTGPISVCFITAWYLVTMGEFSRLRSVWTLQRGSEVCMEEVYVELGRLHQALMVCRYWWCNTMCALTWNSWGPFERRNFFMWSSFRTAVCGCAHWHEIVDVHPGESTRSTGCT